MNLTLLKRDKEKHHVQRKTYCYYKSSRYLSRMKLSQRTASKSHRAIIFGKPKTGKTELVGKLSERFNLLWFDLDNGIDTLKKLPEEWQERIEVISLPDTRSFPIAIQTCLKVIKGGALKICETHGAVSCFYCAKDPLVNPFIEVNLSSLGTDTVVVFDSISQLMSSALAHITKGQAEDYKLQTDDWGSLGKLMDTFFSHVQQSKFHICCISHELDAEKDEKLPEKLVPLGGTRNFSKNVAKYFDEVVYVEVKNRRHIAASSTTYANGILTGSRSGTILENQKEPSLIPVFTGEAVVVEESPMLVGSPAAKAISQLDVIRQKMKGA